MTTSTTPDTASGPDDRSIELVIGGMTCASCAARVEKKLNRMDGVTATVNYATEKARVFYPGTVTPQDLVATVEATGYTAAVPPPPDYRTRRRRHRHRRSGRARRRRRADPGPAAAAGRLGGADRPGARAGDGAGAAVHLLAVAVADAGRTGGHLGGVAVPPGGVDQPAARRRHHGHPDLPRRHRRVRLVAVRAVPRRRRRTGHDHAVQPAAPPGWRRDGDLPRGGHRRHRVPPRRPLLRGPRETTLGCCAAGPAGTGRQRRRRPPRRPRGPAARSINSSSATNSSSAPGRRSPPTGPSPPGRRRWMRRCSPANRCRSRPDRATRSSVAPSTPAAGSPSAPPASAPTPNWRRWVGWSRKRRTARPTCSAWPTGCRRCSCPW